MGEGGHKVQISSDKINVMGNVTYCVVSKKKKKVIPDLH